MVAGETDGLLQGWAILENASGQDWHDVAVTLIGGSPRALRQSLFARRFVERPEVAGRGLDGEGRDAGPTLPSRPRRQSADMVTLLRRAPAGSRPRAAQELTAQTLFPLPQPVTLAVGHTVDGADRRSQGADRADGALSRKRKRPRIRAPPCGSAMTPAPACHPGSPRSTKLLPAGGLTFLGDAPLPQTAAGREQTLAYGVDGTVDVTVQQ